MPRVFSSRGDVARVMLLLWGLDRRSERGPRPKFTVDAITAAAIDIADREGLDRLSMRNVAQLLGTGAMSLYRYVPGKAELLDLMVDRVCAECGNDEGDLNHSDEAAWRVQLARVARANLELYRRHPWLLDVFPGRPPLGPGVLAKYEHELRAAEGTGLGDIELDLMVSAVLGYVRGAAAAVIEADAVADTTGMDDHQWWEASVGVLEEVSYTTAFPVAARVGAAATQHYRGAFDAELTFEFGLRQLLAGIEHHVHHALDTQAP